MIVLIAVWLISCGNGKDYNCLSYRDYSSGWSYAFMRDCEKERDRQQADWDSRGGTRTFVCVNLKEEGKKK